jgi:thiamine-monophosphate kinase
LSTPSSVGALGEHGVIALIRDRLPAAPNWVAVGLGDDAAVVKPARNTFDVLTTDALVEGVHFDRAFTPPAAIGHRALAVNLSDLAAMGATPRVALLSLVLPPELAVADLSALVDGLLGVAAAHGIVLVGGNVTRSPGPLIIDVTAVGFVRPRRVLTRKGARPGDEIWVSGSIGAAAAGLASLASDNAGDPRMASCEAAFLTPEPRLRLGRLLAGNRAATSCVDLSDGLADGLHQLAQASGAGFDVEASAIPVPPAAAEWFAAHGPDALLPAMTGGDDYELLFTVGPRTHRRLETVRRQARSVPLTRIGTVVKTPGVTLIEGGARRPLPPGYVHFR